MSSDASKAPDTQLPANTAECEANLKSKHEATKVRAVHPTLPLKQIGMNFDSAPFYERPLTLQERLVRTHPIWFLPKTERVQTLEYLENTDEGSFIVRQSSVPGSTMALSVRLPQDVGPYVEHYLIEMKEGGGSVKLEGSSHSFHSIPELAAYYMENCDELPIRLLLPKEITIIESRAKLSEIAVKGPLFWSTIKNPTTTDKPYQRQSSDQYKQATRFNSKVLKPQAYQAKDISTSPTSSDADNNGVLNNPSTALESDWRKCSEIGRKHSSTRTLDVKENKPIPPNNLKRSKRRKSNSSKRKANVPSGKASSDDEEYQVAAALSPRRRRTREKKKASANQDAKNTSAKQGESRSFEESTAISRTLMELRNNLRHVIPNAHSKPVVLNPGSLERRAYGRKYRCSDKNVGFVAVINLN